MMRTNPSSATASRAALSPDAPVPGGLCAIHQPNLFPRLTTLAKLVAADIWIVLDDVQFTRRDYQHRTRLAALEDPHRLQWMSISTHLPQGRQTIIREALIVDPGLARRRTMAMLRQHYGASSYWPEIAQALEPIEATFDSGRTASVAEASTRVMLDLLGWKGQIFRSTNLSARSGRSQRLADLTVSVGSRLVSLWDGRHEVSGCGPVCGTGDPSHSIPASDHGYLGARQAGQRPLGPGNARSRRFEGTAADRHGNVHERRIAHAYPPVRCPQRRRAPRVLRLPARVLLPKSGPASAACGVIVPACL